MFQSMRIGRWLGIDVFVHPSFWLLPLFVVLSTGVSSGFDQIVLSLAVLFGVFGCVALHEFGHAIAARWYGIRTRDITLYPIGGVASLERIPARPWPEIVIALAGPAVNVGIATVLGLLMAVDGVSIQSGLRAAPGIEAFVTELFVANVMLVVFNLIPAFPMDGGRVFRATLNFFMDRVSATTAAVAVGSVIAVLMGLYGLWQGNFFLAFLAFSVFMMGRTELAHVRHQSDYDRAVRRAHARIPVVEPVRVRENVDGWVFDPQTGLWTEWRDGMAVRRMRF